MKIAVIGASGFVGKAVTNEALHRNHEVSAISRHAHDLGIVDPHLRPANVDVFDVDALSRVLQGTQAVLSAYNAGWANPRYREDFLKGAANIEVACERAGVTRLLVVGGAGSLQISPGQDLVDGPQFPEEYRAAAKVVRDYLTILRKNTSLDWTFLSPAIIMNAGYKGTRTGHYRTGEDQPVFDAEGTSAISVEDLAVALLDELEKGRYIRKRFTVAY